MSRSYKKTPYCGDRKSQWAKRQANRRVRRLLKNPEEDLSNRLYRKAYCSYDICDYYTTYRNFEEYYRDQINLWYKCRQWRFSTKEEPFPTREQCWKDFHKFYLRK